MYCPSCRGEYREGFIRCQDCDVALVEALPEAEDEPEDWEEMPEDEGNEEPDDGPPTSKAIEGGAVPDRRRSLRAVELLLVLFVVFSRSLVRALYAWVNHLPVPDQSLSLEQSLIWITEAATAIALLSYVLFRQGRSLRRLGLTAEKADVIPTLVLTVLFFVPYAVARGLAGLPALLGPLGDPWKALSGIPSLGLLGIVCLLLAAAREELVVRAYMITEVVDLTGQVPLAVLSSVCFQALYHLYKGWFFASIDAVAFLILSIYYVKYRRITPVILSHWLHNLLLSGYMGPGS